MDELTKLLSAIENQPDNVDLKIALVHEYLKKQDHISATPLLEQILLLDPSNLEANYILAQVHEFDEKYAQAADCLQKVVDQKPSDDMKYKLAQLYESSDNYSKALELYKECHDSNPSDMDVISALGHISRIMKNPDAAITYYEKMVEIEQENMVALTQLLELYEDLDKFKYYLLRAKINEIEGAISHALSSYKKALAEAEAHNDIINIRFHIADICVQSDKLMNAIDEYNAILEIDPRNYTAYKNMAKVYNKLDNLESAYDAYETVLKLNESDTDTLKEFAEVCMDMEKFERALTLYEELLKKEPADLEARTNLARTYIAMDRDEDAQTNLTTVLEKDPKNVQAISVLADLCLIKQDYNSALQNIQKIKQLIPKSPFGYKKAAEIYESSGHMFDAHYNFGVYHQLKGEKQLAIDEFSLALECEPSNLAVILSIAELYEQIGEDYIALEYYQRAYRTDRENVTILRKMADIYKEKKEFEPVVEICERLLELNPRDKDAVFEASSAYEMLKNYDLALSSYKKYLEIAPNSVKSKDVNEKIRKLENRFKEEEDEGFLSRFFRMFSK